MPSDPFCWLLASSCLLERTVPGHWGLTLLQGRLLLILGDCRNARALLFRLKTRPPPECGLHSRALCEIRLQTGASWKSQPALDSSSSLLCFLSSPPGFLWEYFLNTFPRTGLLSIGSASERVGWIKVPGRG